MAKPLSPDLRLRIIRAVEDEGMIGRGAAGRFGVAPSTAIELVSEWRSTGACEAGAQGGDRRSARIEGHAAEILSLVEATPDMTLAEIADHLFKAHGERFVPSVLWRFFDRRNVTFKKTSHASEQDRPDVAEGGSLVVNCASSREGADKVVTDIVAAKRQDPHDPRCHRKRTSRGSQISNDRGMREIM